MIKPDDLRTHLTQALPNLSRDPDRLLVFIDQGTLGATFSPNLSFEWPYTLNLIFTDFAGDPDAIMIALLAWIHDNQSNLLLNPDQQNAIQFEAEILNNTALDLSIKLPLTERVVVRAWCMHRNRCLKRRTRPNSGRSMPVMNCFANRTCAMADDLIDRWALGLLSSTGPQARRRLAETITMALRKSQQRRIAQQANADGSTYAPRKPQTVRSKDVSNVA